MQEQIDELEDGKADLQKQLMRANAENAQLKSKFDQEVSGRLEELEDAKYVLSSSDGCMGPALEGEGGAFSLLSSI